MNISKYSLLVLSLLALSACVSGDKSSVTVANETALLRACTNLVNYYPIPRDELDGIAYGAMFLEDGEFVLRGVTTKGREEIVTSFLARASSSTTRHVTGTVNVNAVSESTATGISYALVFSAEGKPSGEPKPLGSNTLLALVSYKDDFSFDGTRCFFSKRSVNIDFIRNKNNDK